MCLASTISVNIHTYIKVSIDTHISRFKGMNVSLNSLYRVKAVCYFLIYISLSSLHHLCSRKNCPNSL